LILTPNRSACPPNTANAAGNPPHGPLQTRARPAGSRFGADRARPSRAKGSPSPPEGDRAWLGTRSPVMRASGEALAQVLVQCREELLRGEPLLFTADEQGEVLGHLAA